MLKLWQKGTAVALGIALCLPLGCGKKPSGPPPVSTAPAQAQETPGTLVVEMRPQTDYGITPKAAVSPRSVTSAVESLNTAKQLIDALASGDEDIRVIAADKLVRLNDPRVPEALKKAFNDTSEDVRITITAGLVDLPDRKAALDLLKVALQDTSENVRAEAVNDLAFYEPPRDRLPLLDLALKDKEAQIRQTAVNVLNETYIKESIPFLIGALKDSSEDVRRDALEALRSFADNNFETYEQWHQWWVQEGARFKLEEPEETDAGAE